MGVNIDEFVDRVKHLAEEMGVTDRIIIVSEEPKEETPPPIDVTWKDLFDELRFLGGRYQVNYLVDEECNKLYGFYQNVIISDMYEKMLIEVHKLERWQTPPSIRSCDRLFKYFSSDNRIMMVVFYMDRESSDCRVIRADSDDMLRFDLSDTMNLPSLSQLLDRDAIEFLRFMIVKIRKKIGKRRISDPT